VWSGENHHGPELVVASRRQARRTAPRGLESGGRLAGVLLATRQFRKAVHARPPAAVLAGCGYGVTAARKDRTHAMVGVRGLIIHVELEVSAPFECSAMRCASSVAHREVVHTLGSDSFCGGWLIPGPQATSRGAAAAGPYHQPASRELRGLQRDHQNEDKACSAHRYVTTPRCFSTVCATRWSEYIEEFAERIGRWVAWTWPSGRVDLAGLDTSVEGAVMRGGCIGRWVIV
jgi:hypothetical protein